MSDGAAISELAVLVNVEFQKTEFNEGLDEFVELEHITKNLNGKIDKPKIRETFRQRINDS